jgi:hypothetical protein
VEGVPSRVFPGLGLRLVPIKPTEYSANR